MFIRVWSGVPGEESRLIEIAPQGLVSRLASVWGTSKQRVRQLLAEGRVTGAHKHPVTGQWEKLPDVPAVKLKSGKRGPKLRKAFSVHI